MTWFYNNERNYELIASIDKRGAMRITTLSTIKQIDLPTAIISIDYLLNKNLKYISIEIFRLFILIDFTKMKE